VTQNGSSFHSDLHNFCNMTSSLRQHTTTTRMRYKLCIIIIITSQNGASSHFCLRGIQEEDVVNGGVGVGVWRVRGRVRQEGGGVWMPRGG